MSDEQKQIDQPAAPQKKPKKKGRKSTDEKLNQNQEYFCQLYVGGMGSNEYFGNATKCYLTAYGYYSKIRKLEVEMHSCPIGKKGDQCRSKFLKQLEEVRNTAAANGARLLINAKVKERCDQILDSYMNDKHVDREMQYVISQREELGPKVQAVREYNAVKSRVKRQIDFGEGVEGVGMILLPYREGVGLIKPKEEKAKSKKK